MKFPRPSLALVLPHVLLVVYVFARYGLYPGGVAAAVSAVNLCALLSPIGLHMTIGWWGVIGILGMIGFWVPSADAKIGESYLIFFFHFPSAISCMVLFVASGVASATFLATRSSRWDWLASGLVQVGVLACTITLVTGSIWAKAAWGVWWDMTDPRLMTVAIMWLTYIAYLALRLAIDDPVKRARFGAVFGVLACVNVPLVHFAIKLLGKAHHPMDVELGETSMLWTRWLGAAAFIILYGAFTRLAFRVEKYSETLGRMDEKLLEAGV